jgi:hypothetical protein
MEKRIGQKVDDYFDTFKSGIKDWVQNNDSMNFSTKSDLLKFIYDFDNLSLEKEDFTKRKRIKSSVEQYLRCIACRANGEQCTRRKKDGNDYCGTHDKNRPHGIISEQNKNDEKLNKVSVYIQDINGILYYIDDKENVYNTEDILNNILNPKIIAKYKKEGEHYTLIK